MTKRKLDVDDLLREAIVAVKAGQRARARSLLSGVINHRPNDVNAWLWLSGAVETEKEQLACIRRVLAIDPENARALIALSQLDPQAFIDKLEQTVISMEELSAAFEDFVESL